MLPREAKFFIFGSCVTRDIFGDDWADRVAVYMARSSLAAQMGVAWANEHLAAAVASPFQRRMVLADMENLLWPTAKNDPFDLLILDFIDDRFDIFCTPNGALHTLSAEYLAASKALTLVPPDPSKIMPWNGEEKMALWQSGWLRLCDLLAESSRLDRLVINRVFWADRLADGTLLHDGNTAYIDRANTFLQRIYEHIDQVTPGVAALSYDDTLFRADPAHRWGLSAFHYVPEFYESAREQLAAMPIFCRS